MAEECQQEPLVVGHNSSDSVELPQIETLHSVLCDDSTKDILTEPTESSENLNQSSTFNDTHQLPEFTNHLTDHSYIHPSDPNHAPQSRELNSPMSVSDNSLKIDSDSSRDVQLSSIPASDVSNASQILEPCDDSSRKDLLSFSSANDKAFGTTCVMDNPIDTETVLGTQTPVETTVASLGSSTISEPPQQVAEVSVSSNLGRTIIRLPPKQTSAPLGSVKNPIQIIQNGSSFHSTQVLSAAQLQQIARVLQKQQAAKKDQNRKSVMYDPSTNTRIVCRIVHPSELQAKTAKTELQAKKASTEPPPKQTDRNRSSLIRGRGRPRKLSSRKSLEDGNSSLSKEERDEKKKHRPRTRSGRISKPPSYMVKDYKRIHHLDFNEEPYDASDGGYSDFQVSDDEEKRGGKSKNLPPGVTTAKERCYSCPSCSKAYIGKGGLSRHLRLNPSHGRMPEGEDISTQDENSNSSMASSVLSNYGSHANTQPPTLGFTQFPPKFDSASTVLTTSPGSLTSLSSESIGANRRKVPLLEALKDSSMEEIHQTVLPVLSQEISLWDFFLVKCNQKSEGLSIFEMLKEFEQFLSHMQQTCLSSLKPATLEESQGKTIIHISSQHIAAALGLSPGSFEVQKTDPSFSDATSGSVSNAHEVQNSKDDSPSFKRRRVDSPIDDATGGLPEQILSEVIQREDLDLPLTINLSSTSEIHGHEAHTLSSQLCHTDVSQDAVTKALYDLHSSTVVTPSSLSSGCLSAVVNTSSVQSPLILNPHSPQKLHRILMRKSHQELSLTNNNLPLPMNNLPLSTVGDFSQESLIVQKPTEMSSATMSIEPQIDIFNQNIQEISAHSVFNNAGSIGISTSVTLPTTSMIDLNVPNYTSTDSLKTSAPDRYEGSCMSETHISSLQNNGNVSEGMQVTASSVVAEETREYQATTNVIQEVGKLPENPAVLRHLMLPDGQVIGVWSHVNNSEKPLTEQFVQSYVPGNLIILQNPDGSIQVPTNQAIQAETLHTLTTLNPSVSSEVSSEAFAAVQPM